MKMQLFCFVQTNLVELFMYIFILYYFILYLYFTLYNIYILNISYGNINLIFFFLFLGGGG